MRQAMIAALALALGACAPPPGPQPDLGGLPADFPPSMLTDLPESDRAGVEEIIAHYSSGLVGHCTGEEIEATLAFPTILTWFGYAETPSPESVAYIESNQAQLAARYAGLSPECRRRAGALAEQIPD